MSRYKHKEWFGNDMEEENGRKEEKERKEGRKEAQTAEMRGLFNNENGAGM